MQEKSRQQMGHKPIREQRKQSIGPKAGNACVDHLIPPQLTHLHASQDIQRSQMVIADNPMSAHKPLMGKMNGNQQYPNPSYSEAPIAGHQTIQQHWIIVSSTIS
jgi:hypothetical protein